MWDDATPTPAIMYINSTPITQFSIFMLSFCLRKTGWWTANKSPLYIKLFVYHACLEWLGFWSPVSYQFKKKRLQFHHYLTMQLFFYDSYKHYCEKKFVRYLFEEYRHIISILEYICLDKYTYFCTFSYAVNLKF